MTDFNDAATNQALLVLIKRAELEVDRMRVTGGLTTNEATLSSLSEDIDSLQQAIEYLRPKVIDEPRPSAAVNFINQMRLTL